MDDGDDPADSYRLTQADPVQLSWDRKAWEVVAAAKFTGPLYDRLIDQAIRHAIPHLRHFLRSGRIFALCHGRNRAINLSAPSFWTDDDRDELAIHTVAAAASRFLRAAIDGEGWSPHGGATIATYFMNMCIDAFPNQFNAWLTKHKRLQQEQSFDELPAPVGPSPQDAILARDDLQQALHRLLPDQRRAILLQAEGYSHQEIASLTSSTERAVEGLIYRGRKLLEKPWEAQS